MSKYDIQTLLTCDDRFMRNGSQLQAVALSLSEIFSQQEVLDVITNSISSLKHISKYFNLLLYANSKQDSLLFVDISTDAILNVAKTGEIDVEYSDLSDKDLKQYLGSSFVDFKDIEFESTYRTDEFRKAFLASTSIPVKNTDNINLNTETEEYWIKSVQLDFPMIPQPDTSKVEYSTSINSQKYCIYAESTLPWNQSQITALTDVNKFSDADLLRLFPAIRLYTRSPYMYKSYDGLEYDDDLGVIFKIKGFNKRQIKKNLIEYPHLMLLERCVKIKGKDTTIPFWKYIEIDGEMVSTASVWSKLPDTKNLPPTESFMNEYVVRKYLLERDAGISHNHLMRGELLPFLTLYNRPEYYRDLNYDPIEIGKKCVTARIVFKKSRNPMLRMSNFFE